MRSGNLLYDSLNTLLRKRGLILTHVTQKLVFLDLIRKLNPGLSEVELLSFGGQWPGSYSVPNDLAGISSVISPGVGESIAFELDLWRNTGIPA